MKCTYCGFSYDNEAKCPICGTPAPQQPAPTPEKPEPQPFLPPVQPPSGDAPKAPSPAASPAREDSGKGLRIATLCVLGVIASALIYLCLVMTFSYSLERGFESTAKEWSEDYDTFDAFGVPDNDMLNADAKNAATRGSSDSRTLFALPCPAGLCNRKMTAFTPSGKTTALTAAPSPSKASP